MGRAAHPAWTASPGCHRGWCSRIAPGAPARCSGTNGRTWARCPGSGSPGAAAGHPRVAGDARGCKASRAPRLPGARDCARAHSTRPASRPGRRGHGTATPSARSGSRSELRDCYRSRVATAGRRSLRRPPTRPSTPPARPWQSFSVTASRIWSVAGCRQMITGYCICEGKLAGHPHVPEAQPLPSTPEDESPRHLACGMSRKGNPSSFMRLYDRPEWSCVSENRLQSG